MIKNLLKTLNLFFLTIFFLSMSNVCLAALTDPLVVPEPDNEAGFVGGMKDQTESFLTTAEFSTAMETEDIIAAVITTVLSFLGIIFVILIIFSGYQWMTAGGNEDQVKKATARIKNAVIGLIIVVFAYGITAFVFKNLQGGPGKKKNITPKNITPADSTGMIDMKKIV